MKRLICLLLCASILLLLCPLASVAEDSIISISSREDMLLLAKDPNGTFELTNDIDMRGEWLPIPFSGHLNGNGHTLYNLTVHAVGEDTMVTFDGNRIEYETVFAGLFSVVQDAVISDLRLVNAVIDVNTDRHCFTGAIAGYAASSVFTNCSVDLRSHLRITSVNAGIGGLVGFSLINDFQNCNVNAELVFTDQNPDVLCEEFMGGVFASGCGNIRNSSITLRGFTEVYGYAHNGGVIGMVKLPRKYPHLFVLAESTVDVEISFFEITPSRRAYCDPLIGENLAGDCRTVKNTILSFRRSESPVPVHLSPEHCEAPEYTVSVTPHTDDSWGYTTYTCSGCGYSYRDTYTHPGHIFTESRIEPTCTDDGCIVHTCTVCGETYSETLSATGHVPGEFELVKAPEVLQEGLMQQRCTVCGAVLETKTVPALPKIDAERVVLSESMLELHCEEQTQLFAKVLPDDATESEIVYVSSDSDVATVSPDGTITAINRGTAAITAMSADGKACASCTVNVSFTFGQWFRYYILFGWLNDA